jgi:glycosyltransferase involved in cell wall biosynthesis
VFDIARGMREILLNDERRNWLVEAGRRQAQRFHWETTARESLAIYWETANRKTNNN